MTIADPWDDYKPIYWDDDQEDDHPCSRCGPWCDDWGGDGICMIAIREEARAFEQYAAEHIHPDVPCAVCGQKLTLYDVGVDALWHWPSDVHPMIGLSVYAAYSAPKGEIHRAGNVCHVWIGEGEFREEKLIGLAAEAGGPGCSRGQDTREGVPGGG